MNIDAQDAQDNQDERLLHERLTPAMIVCGFVDVQDYKPAVSGKNPVHRCKSKIYACLTEPFAKLGSGIVAGKSHKRHKNTKRAEPRETPRACGLWSERHATGEDAGGTPAL
ncbi:MAG: hypothetical protein OXU26_10995, partial [Acidobacteriota bacterium]|nr:hypothetical protein [Acidobacteriota bacterium]